VCIIIVKPAGKAVTKKQLHNAWDNNDDGAGFVYARDGKLVIHKELHSFRKFWKAYHQNCLDNENVLLHFRIMSSGYHDIQNVHPFLIDENHALVHNGVLSCVKVPLDSDINDTQVFIEEFLRCMVDSGTGGPVDWVNNELAADYAEAVIGKWNKMAVINSNGDVNIWNESEGHWADGCWFSNYTYSYGKSVSTYSYGYPEIGWYEVGNKNYKDKWLEDWERNRFGNREPYGGSQVTFLTDDLAEKKKWPESEDIDSESTDRDVTVYDQGCLECGVLLSKEEIRSGWGCCADCVQKAFEAQDGMVT